MLWGRYHEPGDEYDDVFPLEGLRRDVEFAAAVVRRLDDERSRPLAAGRDYRRVESSLTGPGGIR
jgi:hypothetical protein